MHRTPGAFVEAVCDSTLADRRAAILSDVT